MKWRQWYTSLNWVMSPPSGLLFDKEFGSTCISLPKKIEVSMTSKLISCGKRGIRTPGPVKVNGFQDRRDRPLRHLSKIGCKGTAFFSIMQIRYCIFMIFCPFICISQFFSVPLQPLCVDKREDSPLPSLQREGVDWLLSSISVRPGDRTSFETI